MCSGRKEGPATEFPRSVSVCRRFDSHLEQRMKTEVYTKVNKEKVVLFMHHYLRLMAKYSDLEILEACGRLDTNCFEVIYFVYQPGERDRHPS